MYVIPFILLFSAMLPYLAGGLRTEHLLIPALVLWPLLNAKRIHVDQTLVVGGLLVGAFATAYFSQFSFETGARAEPLSQFIRLLLPALAMMVLPTVLPQREDISVPVAEATLIVGGFVGVFLLLSMVSGQVSDLLTYWIRSEEGGVWLSSQDVGRYTGLFNQPIEAGIFYSVALIAGMHALKFGKMNRLVIFASLVAVMFGGIACLSKNFIVLGAAGALGYAFMIKLISRTVVVFLSIPIIAAIPMALEGLNLDYVTSLRDLYHEGGILAALSAGRFGSAGGSVSQLFESLFATGDWVTGRGLGSHLPLDNGYLEYLYQGGIVALAGYLVALATLSWVAIVNQAYSEGKLLMVLTGYVWLASAGGPAITSSRAGVVLMILMSACLISIRQKREHQGLVRREVFARPRQPLKSAFP